MQERRTCLDVQNFCGPVPFLIDTCVCVNIYITSCIKADGTRRHCFLFRLLVLDACVVYMSHPLSLLVDVALTSNSLLFTWIGRGHRQACKWPNVPLS
jgi:hypothetical protein